MAKWIQKIKMTKGGLHRSLGYKSGEIIPLSVIRSAAKGKGKTAQQARLALTLRRMHH